MSDTGYETSDVLFVNLLNNVCTNPAYIKNGDSEKVGDGFAIYCVELCCLTVAYIAKPIDRDESGMPTRYVVTYVDYDPH